MPVLLIIDDDADFLEALSDAISLSGCQVAGFSRADFALSYLQEHMPDLLITDLIMPVMNGAKFLEALHEMFNGFPCPVIAMSGGGRLDAVPVFDSIQDLPVNAVLHKPFSLDTLDELINDLLD